MYTLEFSRSHTVQSKKVHFKRVDMKMVQHFGKILNIDIDRSTFTMYSFQATIEV